MRAREAHCGAKVVVVELEVAASAGAGLVGRAFGRGCGGGQCGQQLAQARGFEGLPRPQAQEAGHLHRHGLLGHGPLAVGRVEGAAQLGADLVGVVAAQQRDVVALVAVVSIGGQRR